MEPPSQEQPAVDSLQDSHPQEMAELTLTLFTPKRESLPSPALQGGKSTRVAPGSAATGMPPQSLLEVGPSASSEDKASIRQEGNDTELPSVSPLGLLVTGLLASLQDRASAQEQKKDHGLTSASVGITWTPPSRLLDSRPNGSSENKASVQQEAKDYGLTSVPPLRLTEVKTNVCSEDKTFLQEQDNGLTSVSVVPEVTWMSPSRILEASPNASSEDKASNLEQEKENALISVSQLSLLEAGPDASLEEKDSGHTSVPPLSLLEVKTNVCSEDRTSAQKQENYNSMTSGSVVPEVTWASSLSFWEAKPNVCSEEPEKDNVTVAVSVVPEETWMSPSRILEAGLNGSWTLEEKASVQQEVKDNGLTSVSVVPEVTCDASMLLDSRPNGSLQDKASIQQEEKDNGLPPVPPSKLLEAGPNASSEDKASNLEQEKDNAFISVSLLSLLEAGPNASLEEKDSGLTSVSVLPEVTCDASRLLDSGPNGSSENKACVQQEAKEHGLTSVPPLSLLEVKTNVCSEDKTSVHKQENYNSITSASVLSEVTWASSLSFWEAEPNVCSEEPEKDNDTVSVSVVPEETLMSPSRILEAGLNGSWTLEEKASVQQEVKDNGLTSVSVVPEVTWMSPSRILEASPNASSEDKASNLEQEKDNALISVSQLSLLEAGPNAFLEEKDSGLWTSVSVLPEVTCDASRLLDSRPNGSLQDKASIQQEEKDNGLPPVSPSKLLEAGPNASSDDKASSPEQEKDNGILSVFVSPAASQMFHLNLLESGLNPSPMRRASALWHQQKEAVSRVSAATWMSPLGLLETGVNTSLEERTLTKDSTAETDSLLWHFSQDHLSSLSRAELEERLASAQIIVEALSRKIQDCLHSQKSPACVGPADQRDAATQTPTSEPSEEVQLYREMYAALWKLHDPLQKALKNLHALAELLATATGEMRGCLSDSTFVREKAKTTFQRLQEDRCSVSQQQKQLGDLISRLQEKWSKIEGEKKKALRGKEAAEDVLELFQSHASQRIGQLEEGCQSQRHLCTLLAEANTLQADLSGDYAKHLAKEACLATTLRSNWAKMGRDYEAMRTLAGRFRVTMGQMVREVRAAHQELAQHQEVCRKLETSTQELDEALARADELTVAKARLQTELESAREKGRAAESQQDRLRKEKEVLSCQLSEKQSMILKLEEEAARLSWEKAKAEQERDEAQQEAREMTDCREFIDLENQIARRQLLETEEELKATLVTLWERGAQLEDLRGAHSALQREREALSEELASVKVEMERTRSSMEACACSLQEMGDAQEQLLEIVSFLERVLQGEEVDTAPRRRPWTPRRLTPHRFRTSFVDSILQAVAERDVETPGIWSESTAFTKAVREGPPKPSEVQEHLCTRVQDLLAVSEQLRLLTSQHQRASREEVETLQAEILRLQGQMENLEREREAEVDSRVANINKLSKALRDTKQNERELQDIIWQQNRKLQQLADQSADIRILKLEVEQLKSDLGSCEMERSALWEELREQKPSSADWVQEKICLQRQVARLRELLVDKDQETTDLVMRYQGRVRHLEEQLLHAQRETKALKRTEARIKEVASSLPTEASHISEVRLILDILG